MTALAERVGLVPSAIYRHFKTKEDVLFAALDSITDRLVGGVGLRRGRRHPDELREGEALDFWRVEVIEPDRLLRLRAEMKLPGRGWLQFEARPIEEVLHQGMGDARTEVGLARRGHPVVQHP